MWVGLLKVGERVPQVDNILIVSTRATEGWRQRLLGIEGVLLETTSTAMYMSLARITSINERASWTVRPLARMPVALPHNVVSCVGVGCTRLRPVIYGI